MERLTVRTIGVVTTARSDYGIYLPVLHRLRADPELDLHLIVSGMHLSPEFGSTQQVIEDDGFTIGDRIEMLLSSDSPEGIAKSMGLGTIGFAQSYARRRPDILLALGDRFEMHSAVVAALPFKIPVAHIHGGESTEGLIDEAIRHSITKMSHIHFVATEAYGRRVVQMGEETWRVVVTGAPSLDNLNGLSPLSDREMKDKYGLDLTEPPLLVTYHPVTLEYEHTKSRVKELLAALEETGRRTIFTYPNADTAGRVVMDMIRAFTKKNKGHQIVSNLGTVPFFTLMGRAAAMIGNSSSGIIEAASFKLPVVNLGNRQRGRFHGVNVIDVGNSRSEVLAGIEKALTPEFRAGLACLKNAYGDGHASERIVDKLRSVRLDNDLLLKHFHDAERT